MVSSLCLQKVQQNKIFQVEKKQMKNFKGSCYTVLENLSN